jgi:agmatinase
MLADAGDVAMGEDPRGSIERDVRALLATGARPILLGGDHSVSFPALRAMREWHPRLTILHIDAHADLYEDFEGDLFSHACPFARVMEEHLADRLVQAGIRTLTAHQVAQAERYRVEIVTMRDWVAGVRPTVSGPVYLSLDIDALDPAFAPGVSHWEPGGLSTRDVLTLIQRIEGTLVGADVVELNPDRDPTGVTAYVAAKFVKELADRMLTDDVTPSATLPGRG